MDCVLKGTLAILSTTKNKWKTTYTVYPKKYEHGFCFAVLCCGYTLTDFPISIRLTSLALGQSLATLMNMDKYFMWIHYERLQNHNKAKHNKTVSIFLGIYCNILTVDAAYITRDTVHISTIIKCHHGQRLMSRYFDGSRGTKFAIIPILCPWTKVHYYSEYRYKVRCPSTRCTYHRG